jgi:hypothetical protein
MISELDQVALTENFPGYRLEAGDVGTVVDITPNGQQLTLEFFDFSGQTVAVIPVSSTQVREIGSREIAHVRLLET